MPSEKDLKDIKRRALAAIQESTEAAELTRAETKYLGRKGELTLILRSLHGMGLAERRTMGSLANALRQELAAAVSARERELASAVKVALFDVTEPGQTVPVGHLHLLTQVRWQIEEFFRSYGFSVLEGPEIESEYYNFESLNIPKDHPARDIWDTFWVDPPAGRASEKQRKKDRLLLRTHTSPMQVRVMEKQLPPLAVLVPGRVFRHEATDARHEHTFDQVEGFLVAKSVTAANMKYILHNLFRHLFGPEVEVRLRPGYFPFTEPSFELVMSCPFCKRKGCSVCGAGWLEMLGAGMIHPKVFEFAGYKKGAWQGFAFGLGVARVAMLKYNIPDIRLFYQNDLRVLTQF